jgi:putative hydrolase of HD superfamily
MNAPDRALLGAVRRLTFEAGGLRRERRHGWQRIFADPESVAEHSHRAAVLAYLLAALARRSEMRFAGVDPCRVSTLVTFHDLHETRTGDDDRVQKRYLAVDRERAMADQVAGLGALGADIAQMWREVETGATPDGLLAKDAEILEMAFTGRELVVLGNRDAQAWIDAAGARLASRTARRLHDLLDTADPGEWWKGLQTAAGPPAASRRGSPGRHPRAAQSSRGDGEPSG